MPDNIVLVLLIFAGSLYAVMKGADWLIEGSSQIAKKLQVSDLIIGLTVVAFGTSLPELVVSVQSAFQGSVELAYANVIGSNIANTLLILGVSSMVIPLVTTPDVRRDLPFISILVFGFAALVVLSRTETPTKFLFEANFHYLGGIGLLLYFVVFIYRILKNDKEGLEHELDGEEESSWSKASILVAVGLVFVIAGGEFTVSSAIKIAQTFGVPESTIGLTIVAFGTSLPELVASLTMAGRNKGDMIIGNIIGSNIMNLTLVLGTAALLSPIAVSAWGVFDMIVLTVVSVLFLILMFRKSKIGNLNRNTGVLFLILYLTYIIVIGTRSNNLGLG